MMPSPAEQARVIAAIRQALRIPGDDTEYVAAFFLVMADVREQHGRDLTPDEAEQIGNHWRANAWLAEQRASGQYAGNQRILTNRYELEESVKDMHIFSLKVNPTSDEVAQHEKFQEFLAQQQAQFDQKMARRATSGCGGVLVTLASVLSLSFSALIAHGVR